MFSTDDYYQSRDVIRFKVKPKHLSETVEAHTFEARKEKPKTTQIAMAWNKIKISFEDVNAE